MLIASSLFLAAMVPQGPGSSVASVVINEFSYDDSGVVDRVFVELYNRTNAPVDISNWVLRGHEGTASSPANAAVTIPANTILQPGAFYVVGQAAGVPNVDLDVPAMDTVLETGPDALTLENGVGTVIDAVAWEYAGWTNATPVWLEGDGMFGDTFNSDSNPQSASRVLDGYDSDSNGCDFNVTRWSPGSSNEGIHSSTPPYYNAFDDVVGSTVAADFNYSFVPGTTASPVALGIPASPQGGNVSTWGNPAGGGTANYYSAGAHPDWVLECYAYLRGPNPALDLDDVETWGMGVRGTSDSFGEPVDIGGLYSYMGKSDFDPGDTGIGWIMNTRQRNSVIYFVDLNDGGNDFNVLVGPISILQDGWQRLRLAVVGGNLVCNLGGTLGCDDGSRYTATSTTTCPGGVWIKYHEEVTAPGAHRPLILDALTITCNQAAATSLAGTGSPTWVGVPVISANSLPSVGNLGFRFIGSNLIPNGASFTMMAIGGATLPGLQIPGAQPGALLLINNVGANTIFNINSPTGTSSTACAVPCLTVLSCLPISGQIFDIDMTLPYAIPFGTSPAMTAHIGN
ncbi:MAG: lamin tail domain-containing protein [Planctomycetes bacterium]|nr:lamin tail domain-containing protein [Planctomycetota bacterium]